MATSMSNVSAAVLAGVIVAVVAAACGRAQQGEDAGPAPAASKEIGAARVPVRPRAAPPVPPLPDLPVLEKQEPVTKLPFGIVLPSRTGSSPCGGSIWTGNQMVAAPCAENGLLFGRDDSGARELVSTKLLKANTTALPAVVDHRFVGLEGPVRDQRTSPACTAFSLATAIDHAVARWTGKPSNVSAMDIWSRYRAPYAREGDRCEPRPGALGRIDLAIRRAHREGMGRVRARREAPQGGLRPLA